MERDGNVVLIGEEVANFGGGAYGAAKGLPARFPKQIVNTPISEAGFTGLGLGAAMSGMRAIVEIMFPDFSLVAADQLFNQIAKVRHMYGGGTDVPLVARTRVAAGFGYGAQHSMDPVGLFGLFSGWRVVAPANAFDYIGLFNTAMTSLDPVLIIEHGALYGRKFPLPAASRDYCIPFGKARVVREGAGITVLGYGSMAQRLQDLGARLDASGVEAEIIDLRTVDFAGIDYETIGRSVEKTGVLAVVEEAPKSQSIGAGIIAEAVERFFDFLDGPPGHITSLDVPPSVSRVLERAALLSDEAVVDQLIAMVRRRWK